MSDTPSMIINIYNPMPESASESVARALQHVAEGEPQTKPVPVPAIQGVTVVDDEEGRRIVVAPELQRLLIAFGWLPPVDGA